MFQNIPWIATNPAEKKRNPDRVKCKLHIFAHNNATYSTTESFGTHFTNIDFKHLYK